jgi:hypothetical protein
MRITLRVAVVSTLVLAGCSSSKPQVDSGSGGDAGADGASDAGAVPATKIDRSGLTNVGTGPLDYSDPNLWACRPGNDPNECHADMTATEFLADGSQRVVPRPYAEHPKFDCFYVYPTVKLDSGGNMVDFSDISAVLDPLLSQAAPFASECEVYAPLYRQVSLGGSGGEGGIATTGDPALGIQDVEGAFRYYLDHLSHGRRFVLMGHSQGTFALTKLIEDTVDKDDALRARMISALLIGGAVTVPVGKNVGGSFQNVPLCEAPGQTGCVIAYNSFAKEAPPPANAVFGKAGAGSETACTTPGPLAKNDGRFLGSYMPVNVFQPAFKPDGFPGVAAGVTTPFTLYRDFFRGECVHASGAHYLEVSVDEAAGDQRTVPPYRSSLTESIGFGLHVSDYNLPLDDLLEAVKLQAAQMK